MPTPQIAKMRYCFNCGAEIGVFTSFDYDELDTCGKPECERESRAEAREQNQDDLDWGRHE